MTTKQELLLNKIVDQYGKDCPYCLDVGYRVVNGGTYAEPEPEQEQCEFCHTNFRSKFNLRNDLEKLLSEE